MAIRDRLVDLGLRAGILIPQAREAPPQRGVTAAATEIRIGDRQQEQEFRQLRQVWQNLAWNAYDKVGEIHDAIEFVANAMSRCRLLAAENDEEGKPVRTEDELAWAVLYDLINGLQEKGGMDGQSAMLHDLGVHLNVPGESMLLGTRDTDTNANIYDIHSLDEVVVQGGKWAKRRWPSAPPEFLEDDAFMLRIWRPHPRWSELADSPLRSNLDRIEELMVLSDSLMAAYRSRIPAGLLGLPEELDFGPIDPETSKDKFDDDFLKAITTPIKDPRSAAAYAPLVIRGKGEVLDKINYKPFTKQLDEKDVERRKELIERLARGLPLPIEMVVGLGESSNHWTAWLVDEEAFESYIKPPMATVCEALTTGWYRKFLGIAGHPNPDSLRVWFDPSELVVRPDRSKDATIGLERGALGHEAWRKYNNFSEDDAPTPEELERLILFRLGRSEQIDIRPEPTDVMPDIEESPIAAAATRSRLGSRLARIDRDLFRHLVALADMSVRRALERAGNRLRSRIMGSAKRANVEDAINKVPSMEVAARLGPSTVKRLGVDEDELLEAAALDFGIQAGRAITAAQAKTLRILAREFGVTEEELEGIYGQRLERGKEEGLGLLIGAVAGFTKASLYAPSPAPPDKGEFDGLLAPKGAIRSTMALAGGANAADLQAGIAQGEIAKEVLSENGVRIRAYLWTWGGSEKPFPAHEDLDQVEFSGPTDPVLVVKPGDEWIGRTHYEIADHPGCSCAVEWLVE